MSGPADDARKQREEAEQVKAESRQVRVQTLTTELSMCFTLAGLAETEFKTGELEAAERTLTDAEKGYSTMVRFLTDPEHARHLSPEVLQELTAGTERLRTTLDAVKRLKQR